MSGQDQHSYYDLRKLSDVFSFKFSPTIGTSDIYRAAFRGNEARAQFTLPLLNPTWRVVADMIHEMTHALQKYTESNAVDQTFRNEMEAHLNERAYLNALGEKYPLFQTMIPTYDYIVASGVPKVVFVGSAVMPKSPSLCSEVTKAYHLDPSKISDDSLKRFGCLK